LYCYYFQFTVSDEEKEKDLRCLNLIIHNLVEPIQEDGLARKHADNQKVSKVIHDYLGVSATVNSAIRLGKQGTRGGVQYLLQKFFIV